jgi:hypothetical protein
MYWIFIIITTVVIIATSLLFGFNKFLKIFFLPNKEEALAGKMAITGVAAILYSIYHYMTAMFIAATIVISLNSFGYSFWIIVIIMWIINALNGLLVLIINSKSDIDLTLYAGLGRIVDALTTKKISGSLISIIFIIKIVIWDGPGELMIFLRPKITSKRFAVFIFLFAAGFQMIPWVLIYLKSYDSLTQLF